MESNDLRKTDIKNRICYYYNGIININDIDLENILLGEKSYKNMCIIKLHMQSQKAYNFYRLYLMK